MTHHTPTATGPTLSRTTAFGRELLAMSFSVLEDRLENAALAKAAQRKALEDLSGGERHAAVAINLQQRMQIQLGEIIGMLRGVAVDIRSEAAFTVLVEFVCLESRRASSRVPDQRQHSLQLLKDLAATLGESQRLEREVAACLPDIPAEQMN